jgi:hypothetical protein
MPKIISMSNTDLDRRFGAKDPDLTTDGTGEQAGPVAEQERDRKQQKDALRAPVIDALKGALKGLTYSDRGDLIAYWFDSCRYSYETIAERFEMETVAVRVCKCRALAKHPCGGTRRKCSGSPGCTHDRGRSVWDRLEREIVPAFRGDSGSAPPRSR